LRRFFCRINPCVTAVTGRMHEPLAQSAEHRTFNPGVVGSTPTRLTIAVPSSSGLGHSPFKAATRVQIPLGPPFFNLSAGVAQLVEQRTRNAQVGGSSPPAGSRVSISMFPM
jgi:hypothetical protein